MVSTRKERGGGVGMVDQRLPFRQRKALARGNEKRRRKVKQNGPAAAEQTHESVETHCESETVVPSCSSLQVTNIRKTLQILRRQLVNEDRGRKIREKLPSSKATYSSLVGIVRSTVEGSNESVLVVGGSGSSKYEICNSVMSFVRKEYGKNVGVVRLNGMLHTDECSALREIARQLCHTWGLSFQKSASFSTNMRFLKHILSELVKSEKTSIFVLESFDLYAMKQKQGLLYNLLDLLQGSHAQAAVIGVSSRHDCVELMEKRARSRFSYKKVVVEAPSAEEGMHVLKELLTVPEDVPGFAECAEFKEFNRSMAQMLSLAQPKAILDRFFKCNASIYTVEHLVLGLICAMDSADSMLTLPMLKACCGSMSVTTFMKQALQMPILDLILLIAMQRLEMKEKTSYNFHHIYEEYQHMLSLNSTPSVKKFNFGKEAALESYARLIDQKFLMLMDTRRYVQLEFRLASLLMMGMDLEETISKHPNCPEVLRHWLWRKN